LRRLLVSDLAPFIPVWLFGVVLAASLDYFGLVGQRLPLGDLDDFAGYYSLLVGAMATVNLLRHYRSAPRAIALDADGLRATFPTFAASRPDFVIPFGQIRAVYLSGFFGPHLEAIPTGARWMSMPLSSENAHAVAAAWTDWRGRESSGPSTPS
jgi:hypothetical protein